MTSVPGLKTEMRFEWTTQKPKGNDSTGEISPPFCLRHGQCNFRLVQGWSSNDYIYVLYVQQTDRSRRVFPLPLDISVVIVKGPDTCHCHVRTLVSAIPSGIWCKSVPDIRKIVSDFDATPLVSFRITIRINGGDFPPKTDEKVVQTLSYLDNYADFEALSHDFAKLLDGGLNHDVEITCGNLSFKVHKNVLSTRSEVFAAMFQSDMKEGQTGQVTIQDMESDFFQQFLHYLYSGILPVLTVDSAIQLYEAADKYAIEVLKKQCGNFLMDNLTRESVCAVFIMADQHSDANLRESAIAYIMDQKIPMCDDLWRNFSKSHPTLAIEVLQRSYKVQNSAAARGSKNR